MLHLLFVATVPIVLLSGWTSAAFPDDPKPCKYEDSECIIKLINYYMNEMSQGDSSINMVNIDPLQVSKIRIKQGADSPVNIDLQVSKCRILGLKDARTYKVKGFGKDLTQKHEIHMRMKQVSTVGEYTINGKVLILPIRGSGKSNTTLVNSDMGIYFTGAPYEKDGETYLKIQNFTLTVELKGVIFNFENLFNDKLLSDTMNMFLNDNWKDIFNEVRVSMEEGFSTIFEKVIAAVFTKYPYEKFFAQ